MIKHWSRYLIELELGLKDLFIEKERAQNEEEVRNLERDIYDQSTKILGVRDGVNLVREETDIVRQLKSLPKAPVEKDSDVKYLVLKGRDDAIRNLLHPISQAEMIRALREGDSGSIQLESGWYSIDFFDRVLNAIPGVSSNVYKDSKKVTLLVGNPNLALKLNKEVAKILGLPKRRLTPLLIYKGTYNVSPYNSMLVHRRELN